MSSCEQVLAAGDIDLVDLVELIAPLFPEPPTFYEDSYGFQEWMIVDAKLCPVWYLDDCGMPLSQYRFDISTRRTARYDEEAAEWADSVYDLLSEQTDLDLIRVFDLQELRAHRPSRLHPVPWPEQPTDAKPAPRPEALRVRAA
jgi:hypothetical protein